jgi:hypothetical protein
MTVGLAGSVWLEAEAVGRVGRVGRDGCDANAAGAPSRVKVVMKAAMNRAMVVSFLSWC